MRPFIRVGDTHTGGGEVLAGSPHMTFAGRKLARRGDPVSCPRHGRNEIVEGDAAFTDNGIPVALHGHRCACGCTLIASLSQAGKA
ncbi:PAAR domain-containing protein [Vogesella amnigena]|uniref:PAAR domain-containing protein n=1 Tax=Vogesella amnigena TaxID=1507449 RepID=A0ABV7TT73_9NEIS